MPVTIKGTTTVTSNVPTVFAYLADLKNDKFWRKEINWTTMSTRPQIGVRAIESSYLSKRVPANVLELICTEFAENRKVVYTTIGTSDFYLQSTREVVPAPEGKTEIRYEVVFSENIVKHGLGFSLPAFLIKMAASRDMKKYLQKLKAILEGKK